MKIKRAFLVGCPRSGTTLLQSMIASHSQVISFPETHFFSETLPINPILRRLKPYGPAGRAKVEQFLNRHSYTELNPFAADSIYSLYSHKNWCRKLVHILDQMIAHDIEDKTDGTVWGLEKTPRHLHYISSIEQANSVNKFLHILRHGPDVVASLHLATKQYPEQWDGKRSVKKCINWWNNSMGQSLKYREKSNHLFVAYEQLIESPKSVLKAISDFLNVKYEKRMVHNFHQTADSLTKAEEEWKKQNTKQSLSKSDKLEIHFDDSTISYIKKKTLNINLNQFYH